MCLEIRPNYPVNIISLPSGPCAIGWKTFDLDGGDIRPTFYPEVKYKITTNTVGFLSIKEEIQALQEIRLTFYDKECKKYSYRTQRLLEFGLHVYLTKHKRIESQIPVLIDPRNFLMFGVGTMATATELIVPTVEWAVNNLGITGLRRQTLSQLWYNYINYLEE